jgi:hypothetical protein
MLCVALGWSSWQASIRRCFSGHSGRAQPAFAEAGGRCAR